jgi:hypothetical protein
MQNPLAPASKLFPVPFGIPAGPPSFLPICIDELAPFDDPVEAGLSLGRRLREDGEQMGKVEDLGDVEEGDGSRRRRTGSSVTELNGVREEGRNDGSSVGEKGEVDD